MTRFLLLFVLCGTIHSSSYAQPEKWELGFLLGLANYEGDVVTPQLFTTKESNFAYGVFIRHNINANLAARLNLLSGTISGDDTNFTEPAWRPQRAYNFKSSLLEISGQLEWDILGHKRYRKVKSDENDMDANMEKDNMPTRYKFKKTFSPYLFVGAGAVIFNPEPDMSASTLGKADEIAADLRGDYSQVQLTIPIGAGLKYDLSHKLQLGAEAGFRTAFTDYLDGISLSANPDKNDWYIFGGLTLAFKLGSKDSDKDGIVDIEDSCPDVAGTKAMGGCPDSDDDGIRDIDDLCPLVAGTQQFRGCPDSDKDGIMDKEDNCPNVPGLETFSGCPDSDEDGIMDSEDKCPNIPGLKEEKGCPPPDTDGDGIADKADKCPNEAGIAALNGCPDPDRDKDGVENDKDACPNEAGTADGCPDLDRDGVADKEDDCPAVPGVKTNKGCPIIAEAEKQILNEAMRMVQFRTASAELLEQSYPILNQVVDLLKRYPNYNLRIEGYTDQVGNEISNQTLSEERARACFFYLNEKGVAKTRMTHKGYGETRPIATNGTKAGRQQNRRVEFHLDLPK